MGDASKIFVWSAILFSVLLEFLFWWATSCTNAAHAFHSSMYLSTNASNSFLDEQFSRLSSVGVNSQSLRLLFKFKVNLANTRRSNASSSCAVMLVSPLYLYI